MAVQAVTERGEQSRRAILEAAAPIFSKHGYESASLNQIIQASGLTKGGFYFHFPTKEALALAVISENQRRWKDLILKEAAKYPTSMERLFAVPRFLVRLSLKGEGPVVQHRLEQELAQNPKLRAQVCGSIRSWIDMVTDQFREAQRDGYLRTEVDPHALAEVAVGGFNGLYALTEWLSDDELESRAESLIRVVKLATLKNPKARSAK